MSDPKRTARAIVDRFLAGESIISILLDIGGVNPEEWREIEAIIRRALREKPREASSLYIESEERDMANEKKAKRRKP